MGHGNAAINPCWLVYLKINIHAIGSIKSGPEFDLIRKYQKRLRWQVSVREYQSKKAGAMAEIQQEEAKLLLQAIPDNAQVIALDERGQSLSSQEFALLFSEMQIHGQSECFILIGGADGLAPVVRARSNRMVCFGKMTWPHKFVRVMLMEQLYRAQQIHQGHPYHK